MKVVLNLIVNEFVFKSSEIMEDFIFVLTSETPNPFMFITDTISQDLCLQCILVLYNSENRSHK